MPGVPFIMRLTSKGNDTLNQLCCFILAFRNNMLATYSSHFVDRSLQRSILHVALILAATFSTPVDAAPVRAVDSQGRSYFPKDATKTIPECRYSWTKSPLQQVQVFDAEDQFWLARNLRAAREPSLIGSARLIKYPESYRFVYWSGGWSTVIIRIELGSKRSRIIAKQATRLYDQLTRRKLRSLTDVEVSRFRSLLSQSRFFDQRPGNCKLLVDGSTWFFESVKPGEFDFVERASPAANETAFAIGKFLFGLTGWKSSYLYSEIQETKQGGNEPDGYEYDY